MILPTFIFYFTNRFDLALMVYKIKKINGSQKESIMPNMIKKIIISLIYEKIVNSDLQ